MSEPTPPTANPEPKGAPTATPRRRRKLGWKRWLIFLSIPYVLLALVLLGIEGYVRLTRPYVPSLQILVEVALPGLTQDKSKNYVYRGDPWLCWSFLPNLKDCWWEFTTFSTNDQGIRYPVHVGSKPKGVTRILCMGDSITFGYRVPQTFPERPMSFADDLIPYAAHMEKLLNEGRPTIDYEVVPLGIPGYSSHHGRIWLERDIKKFDPDIVTILYGFNDTYLMGAEDKEIIKTGWLRVIQRELLMRSQAMFYISNWVAERNGQVKLTADKETTKRLIPRVSKDDYVKNIMEMTEIARSHGAEPIIISPLFRDFTTQNEQAMRILEYGRDLEAAAQSKKVHFLRLSSLDMSSWPQNDSFFSEVVHPDYAGHQMMANELLGFMEQEKLLQPSRPRDQPE